MSEIKQINTGVAEIIAVKVQEGAREFKVFHDERPYLSFFDGYTTPRIYLPCDAEIVGISDQLTEEQAREVMPQMQDSGYPFEKQEATETLADFMQANGCYSVNPYGEMPVNKDFYWGYLADLEQWQQAEANTGTWLILVKK
jgi:hypothetical protein